MIKILSLLPVVGQPRHSKRISMLKEAGFNVEAIAFERDYHKGRIPDCPIETLGTISHGHYLQRFAKILAGISTLRTSIRRNHLVYAFGPDMAFAAIIATIGINKAVIVEIGDIRRIQVEQGLRGFLVRMIDRFTVASCCLLVATAPGYVQHYYRRWLGVDTPALIVENKLEFPGIGRFHTKIPASMEGRPLIDRPLRIGYFGVLRCSWSWAVLEMLATKMPQKFEIIVAGIAMEPNDLSERAKTRKNIKFKGPYRSPKDLPSIYGSVDMVWACYPKPDSQDRNWRWARTNRFYESCYFKRPVIALAGSGDADEVEHHKIGMILPIDSFEKTIDVLSTITYRRVVSWQNNVDKVPTNVYLYSKEVRELEQSIMRIVNNSQQS